VGVALVGDMEKFTLDDVGLLLRHRRQATIERLFDIGVTERTRDLGA